MFSPKIFDLDFTHPAIPGSRMTALRATEDGAPVLTVADRASGAIRTCRLEDLRVTPDAAIAVTIDGLKALGWRMPWSGSAYAELDLHGVTVTAWRDQMPHIERNGARLPEEAFVAMALAVAEIVERYAVPLPPLSEATAPSPVEPEPEIEADEEDRF